MAYALMVRMGPLTEARNDADGYLNSRVVTPKGRPDDGRDDGQKRAALRAALAAQRGGR